MEEPMCNDARHNVKRQILSPPYREGDFSPGEFIYDPDSGWSELRTGMIVNRNGDWRVTLGPKAVAMDWLDEPLASYKRRIGRHVLINNSGLGPRRGRS